MAKKISICALCGKRDCVGGYDHVPPRSIFTKPLPQNLITVPACFECNNGGSRDDEVFKTFFSFLLGISPATDSLFKSAIATAKKKFSRNILASIKPAWLGTSSGIIYDKGYIFPLTPEISASFEAVIKRMTAGLYYHHFRQYIGGDTVFQVRFHNVLKKEMLEQVVFSVNKIGSGHFSYGYAKGVEDKKSMSLWLFEFYERYWVSCGALCESA